MTHSTTEHRRPLQLLIGNAHSGVEEVVSVGDAGPGTALDDRSIFRMASMTKIMGGMLAAIAFEEGVVSPSDHVAKWIPEFAAERLRGATEKTDAGGTTVVPLHRNVTLFDLMGMQAGFSYGFFATGPNSADATTPPGDAIFPALLTDGCDAITTITGTTPLPHNMSDFDFSALDLFCFMA